jgi:hypothetical protein
VTDFSYEPTLTVGYGVASIVMSVLAQDWRTD